MSSLKTEVLGTGCKKCRQLEANVQEAISSLDVEAEVLHITDPMQIAEQGVMKTPALMVNGQVVAQGKVLTAEQIKPYLTA